jgi:O-6-methylguanine DNA methyltransferase
MKTKPQSLLTRPLDTADGTFIAHYSPRGLAALEFPPSRRPENVKAVPVTIRRWHQITQTALRAVLAGRNPEALPPLDLSGGTAFQRQVWNQLRKLRSGETSSYGELARRIGKPGAARAVGGACGANPVPVLVPCHRVLASDGGLGGFSGGLKWKRLLLARERR